MKKVIGGFLEMERASGKEYYSDVLRFNLARTALVYAVQTLGYRCIHIPCYICGCIPMILEKYGIEYKYYHITSWFNPDVEDFLRQDEAVLLVNYFGIFNEKQILEFSRIYDGRIIVDNTQAFFADSVRGIPTIYTCRKWFGVADGAYLANVGQSVRYDGIPDDYSGKRIEHLAQKFENRETELYKIYSEIEEGFNQAEIKKMSKVTSNLLCCVDYASIKEKRWTNWMLLNERLGDLSDFEIRSESVPFMYAFYLEGANELKVGLKSRGIFLPTLWPNNLDLDPLWQEHKIAKNLMCLPIDQRYNEDDMNYLADAIEAVLP